MLIKTQTKLRTLNNKSLFRLTKRLKRKKESTKRKSKSVMSLSIKLDLKD